MSDGGPFEPSAPAAASPVFELDFELTADDFVAYAEHLALTGDFYLSQMQRTRRLLVAMCFVVLALFALVERDPAATVIMAVALAIVLAVLWFSWPSRWRSVLRNQSRRQAAMEQRPSALGPKRYRIDAEGLSFSGLYSGGYALWPAIIRVTSDEHAAYLHISQASAHILPRRAFGSAEAFAAFVERAKLWQSVAGATA